MRKFNQKVSSERVLVLTLWQKKYEQALQERAKGSLFKANGG